MHVVRFGDAPIYQADGHHGTTLRRLQGREASPAQHLWIGLSEIAPGGEIAFAAAGDEKLYVVVEGCLHFESEDGAAVLQRLDSCRFAPLERRRIRNMGAEPALLLLAMPTPK